MEEATLVRIFSASLLTLAAAVALPASGQERGGRERDVPESARSMRNPLPATPEILEQAMSLYRKNCLTCHGASGKGDGPAAQFVNPAPANLSSTEVQDRLTDGEIYWRVTEGLDPMPAFKRKLSDEERWKLVLHVRSLGKR